MVQAVFALIIAQMQISVNSFAIKAAVHSKRMHLLKHQMQHLHAQTNINLILQNLQLMLKMDNHGLFNMVLDQLMVS